jgi:uncharacterized integral membrane protein
MRIKTITIIVLTMLVTIVLMQNNQEAAFTILFSEIRISKLIMMTGMILFGFILGVVMARPRKAKFDNAHPSMDNPVPGKSNTLSDEDREYLE